MAPSNRPQTLKRTVHTTPSYAVPDGIAQDFTQLLLLPARRRLAEEHGVRIKAARMDIYGLCRACQALAPANDEALG